MVPSFKIVVTGVTGGNGWETFSRIARFPFVRAYGLVRKEEDISKVWRKWTDLDQGETEHHHFQPVITNKVQSCVGAYAWVSFKGLSLGKLQARIPNLDAMALERGLHRRDLLLEENLRMYVEDIRMAREHAPDCIYIPEGNPLDIFVRLAVKKGFPAKRVISSGEGLGAWRLQQIFDEEFPGTGRSRNSTPVLGEHGEMAVILRSRVLLGGVRPDEYLRDLGYKDPENLLERIYGRVNTEAFEIQQATGETPHFAPGAVTANMISMLFADRSAIVPVSTYIARSEHYGVDDVAMTVPVSLGFGGVRCIHNLNLPPEEMQAIRASAAHIKQVNGMADQLLAEII
jgi:malate/lactate dehydrogenase